MDNGGKKREGGSPSGLISDRRPRAPLVQISFSPQPSAAIKIKDIAAIIFDKKILQNSRGISDTLKGISDTV